MISGSQAGVMKNYGGKKENKLIIDNGRHHSNMVQQPLETGTLPITPASDYHNTLFIDGFPKQENDLESDVEDCEVLDEDEEHISNYTNVNIGMPSRMTYDCLTE